MNQQQDLYAKALERAHTVGLRVMGKGTWTREQGGQPFLVVGSASEPSRYHLVTIYPGRMSCDCHAGRYGRMCSHRALAHEEIAVEAKRAAAEADRAQAAITAWNADLDELESDMARKRRRREREREEAARQQRERDMALPAYRSDNRPFSIWKS